MAELPKSIKIELSTETKRAFAKLTKAVEELSKMKAPDFTEVNRKLREAFPHMEEAPRLEPDISEPETIWERVIGNDECYITEDGKVISYRDQEYFKPCGEIVLDGQTPIGVAPTYCVKIVDHPSHVHEDKYGYIRNTA